MCFTRSKNVRFRPFSFRANVLRVQANLGILMKTDHKGRVSVNKELIESVWVVKRHAADTENAPFRDFSIDVEKNVDDGVNVRKRSHKQSGTVLDTAPLRMGFFYGKDESDENI